MLLSTPGILSQHIHAWEEGHNISGLSLMVMGWKIISSHDHCWATDELSLSEKSVVKFLFIV